MNQYPGEYIVDIIEVFVAASKNIARISPLLPSNDRTWECWLQSFYGSLTPSTV
jgi:hypothetical protein